MDDVNQVLQFMSHHTYLMGPIWGLCQQVLQRIDDMHKADESCKSLRELVKSITICLPDLEACRPSPAKATALHELRVALQSAVEFVEVYPRRGCLSRAFRAPKVLEMARLVKERMDSALKLLQMCVPMTLDRMETQLENLVATAEQCATKDDVTQLVHQGQENFERLARVAERHLAHSQQHDCLQAQQMQDLKDMVQQCMLGGTLSNMEVEKESLQTMVQTLRANKDHREADYINQIIAVLEEQAAEYTARRQALEARVCAMRKELQCPISHDILEDPVVLHPSGCTYSRRQIQQFWDLGYSKCPMTNMPLGSDLIVSPNIIARNDLDVLRCLEAQLAAMPASAQEQPSLDGDMWVADNSEHDQCSSGYSTAASEFDDGSTGGLQDDKACLTSQYMGLRCLQEDNKPARGVVTCPDGRRYDGDWEQGKKHGKGVFTWPSGDGYDGDWEQDKRHGKGVYTWPDGGTHDGDWKEGYVHGKGTRRWPDGERYDGDWERDNKHGNGVYTWPDGGTYDGDWKEGYKHGKGTRRWPNGNRYDGDWEQGKRHGKGVFDWPSGDRHDGDWERDNKHGNGVYTWPDGGTYDGDWKEGYKHGKGTRRWPNGNRYDGDWEQGKRHGKGVFDWPSGDRYDGDWERDNKHGKGVYTWPDGGTYDGDWKEGYMHGKGTRRWPNGNRYNGDWEQDKEHGKGVFTRPGGRTYDGDWKMGRMHGSFIQLYRSWR